MTNRTDLVQPLSARLLSMARGGTVGSQKTLLHGEAEQDSGVLVRRQLLPSCVSCPAVWASSVLGLFLRVMLLTGLHPRWFFSGVLESWAFKLPQGMGKYLPPDKEEACSPSSTKVGCSKLCILSSAAQFELCLSGAFLPPAPSGLRTRRTHTDMRRLRPPAVCEAAQSLCLTHEPLFSQVPRVSNRLTHQCRCGIESKPRLSY